MRHKIASITQRLRLPTICVLCNQYHQGDQALCTACCKYLNPLGPACKHCALPLPASDFLVCGHCTKNKPYINHTYAPCLYEEPLRSLLHEFKYHEGLYLGSLLANLIIQVLPKDAKETQCLIPVPMHSKRLRMRGFNQAAELSKHIAHHLKLPYDLHSCTKIRNTIAQAHLNGAERRLNLMQAFKAKPLKYEHVTLIDDLYTTGSTANELAKTLKSQGISRVDLWCCARAIL